MSDINGINKGVVFLGFLLAFLLTEFAIYLMFPSVNVLFGYFMALTVPFMLLVTCITVLDELPRSKFLSSEKKGFYEMIKEMGYFIGDSLALSIFIIPIALLIIYGLDFFGLTYGGPLTNNIAFLAACILIPVIFLLVYFGIFRLAIVSVTLASPEKAANNFEESPRRYACPQCGNIFDKPTYVCDCGEHYPDSNGNPRLIPTVRETDYIRCTNPNCGKMLPVTDQNGRDALKMVCPDCDCALAAKTSNTVVVTLAGPSGSGKTAFAFSAMTALKNAVKARRPYPGSYPSVTPAAFVPPYMVCFDVSNYKNRCLAIYDVNGKFFDGTRYYAWHQPQFGQEEAIFFVVDPLSSLGPDKAERAANDFWQKHHDSTQTSLTGKIGTPLHVVVTHGDQISGRPDPKDCLMTTGYDRLVSSLESNFSNIRYHICDALDPKEVAKIFREAFEPIDKEVADAFSKI